jgi:hypothetical protein
MGRAAIAPPLGETTARPFSGRLATDDLSDRPAAIAAFVSSTNTHDEAMRCMSPSCRYNPPDSRSRKFRTPLGTDKKATVFHEFCTAQEMLVGQTEFAIDKEGYDDPFFAHDQCDVAAG